MTLPTIRVLVPVADGSEDIELCCITDILTRAGVAVTVASVMPEGRLQVTLARNLKLVADTHIDHLLGSPDEDRRFDAMFLPGGMPGAALLGRSAALMHLLVDHVGQKRLYGAICAAPAVALGPNNLLAGVERATCFPALKDKFPTGVVWVDEPVVLSGLCLTGQGPAAAMAFALSAAAALVGHQKAVDISNSMLFNPLAIVG